MAKSALKTFASTAPVPQSREAAAEAVGAIGRLQREMARLETMMNDGIAAVKEAHEARAAPMAREIEALTEGLRVWADANRDALTNGGEIKQADLGTGLIKWRLRPPSVGGVPKAPEKLAALIERLRALGLGRFVRVKEEIDREAMLREPEAAATAPGIRIGRAGEDFVVEPFEAELTGGAA